MSVLTQLAEVRRNVTVKLLNSRSSQTAAHAKRILESLLDDPLDYDKVSRLCFEGPIKANGLRPLYWKIVLRYLPLDISLWDEQLTYKRSAYYDYKEDFIIKQDLTSKFVQLYHLTNNRPPIPTSPVNLDDVTDVVCTDSSDTQLVDASEATGAETNPHRSAGCVCKKENSTTQQEDSAGNELRDSDATNGQMEPSDLTEYNNGDRGLYEFDVISDPAHRCKEGGVTYVSCERANIETERNKEKILENGEAVLSDDSMSQPPPKFESLFSDDFTGVDDCSLRSINRVVNYQTSPNKATSDKKSNQSQISSRVDRRDSTHKNDKSPGGCIDNTVRCSNFGVTDEVILGRSVAFTHPLRRMASDEKWRSLCKDAGTFDQINKDVYRTRPEIHLLSKSLYNANTTPNETKTTTNTSEISDIVNPTKHYDLFCRILFLYSKINPRIGYVQGMNELLAPIYYCFFTDPTTDHNINQIEADVFFCFSELMRLHNQQECFCNSLDDSDVGIMGRMVRFAALLKRNEPLVYKHITSLGVEIQFFALRWLLLMLSQEFSLSDILRLWDSFIADDAQPLPVFYYVSVVIVRKLRSSLLNGDFCKCMNLLQKFPHYNVNILLSEAIDMRRADIALGIQPYIEGQLLMKYSGTSFPVVYHSQDNDIKRLPNSQEESDNPEVEQQNDSVRSADSIEFASNNLEYFNGKQSVKEEVNIFTDISRNFKKNAASWLKDVQRGLPVSSIKGILNKPLIGAQEMQSMPSPRSRGSHSVTSNSEFNRQERQKLTPSRTDNVDIYANGQRTLEPSQPSGIAQTVKELYVNAVKSDAAQWKSAATGYARSKAKAVVQLF